MHSLEFYTPNTVEEACTLLQELGSKATVLAGGTDVVMRHNKGIVAYEKMVSIAKLDALRGITEKDGALCIGALTTHAQVAENALVKEHFPALAHACLQVGSALIRNRGTVGGNICNASPVADSVCALMALNATFCLQSVSGTRQVAVADFFTGPGQCVRKADELLTCICIPLAKQEQCFSKLGPRKNADIAVVNMAFAFEMQNGVVAEAKVAFGAVAPTVIRISQAEQLMNGKKPAELNLDAIAQACEAGVRPISDWRGSKEYRTKTAYFLVRDALEALIKKL